MLEIEFNLKQPQTTWNARIHQLNSDILMRHVLPKLQASSVFIDFQYDEKDGEGTILCDEGSKIGSFIVK
ncbi:hypothetical protein L3V31_03380 [Vibrio sp. J1-1]|uniref:hypothetical protein n=1 Tax=Vibrio sp. J1-1 TaxID=2912251 RepID=UPI001E10CFCB|nr:hypothetical protein [Vibrio sp. J1-1]MBR9786589.1 hypothetical protein [Vibrionaceae bacterium]MBR9876330.1 hypothetical protein [Vibrionaceae bacterium]MCF7480782.1 hypothetical protein [Vibrio sp. J1-1]